MRTRALFTLVAFSIAAGWLAGAPAWAGHCSFNTVGTVAFGSYDVFSSGPLDTTATVSYKCSPPVTTPTISLSAGGGGAFNPRRMTGPSVGSTADYNLYLDAARTTIWGDGTGGTSVITAPDPTSASAVYTYTIYARVPDGQDLEAGAYTDAVTVTINF
jgi:spore coat protein U-like protein